MCCQHNTAIINYHQLDQHVGVSLMVSSSSVSISNHKLNLIEYQTVSCLANVVKIPKSDGFISRRGY